MEDFSENRILDLLPVGVLAADRDLIICRINPAACHILGICEAEEYLGSPVGRIMETGAFLRLRDGEEAAFCEDIAPAGGRFRIEASFARDAEGTMLLCVLHERAEQRNENEARSASSRHAAALADAICEKQLRIVQEIAGLLGESAVETQTAVAELKKALLPDRKDQNG